jgi:dUTP pyrophosphatase
VEIQVRLAKSAQVPLPAYQTPASAGMDLRAALETPLVLEAGARSLIPTGLRLEIPPGYEGQVRPRSGLALKRGLTVLNSPGTIDADYRGEVGVILINLSREAQRIEPGERIAQLVFAPVARVTLVEAETLADSERGAGGFGSTGVK